MFRRVVPSLAPHVAVVLSGCGVYDGAEITEAASTLIHLSAKGCTYTCFAPHDNQFHVVNHQAGAPEEGKAARNMAEEAARIARGPVEDVKDFAEVNKKNKFDAVIFPGGFGVMKNLSSYAIEGKEGKVRQDVADLLNHTAFDLQKPIGLACIAPVLAAAVFGPQVTDKGLPPVSITLGAESGNDSVGLVKSLGAVHHVECKVNQVSYYPSLKIACAPAYMYGDATPAQVYDSIGALVNKVLLEIK